MSKYDFELDLKHENSVSLIIDMIKPNSKVLEFGPANGRMTKYLNKKMNCSVDIVEIDEQSGIEAAKYSNKSLIGIDKGDIEKFYWEDELKHEEYDYIVFADVLEHLHNPKKVLENCDKLLKIDGSIIVSIPNIAHNSVIIDLINDEFKYNEIGLLDNTHISFFTYKSLIRMIEECGYKAVSENGTYCGVGKNEIINSYSSVSRELGKKLRERDTGNLYQFVFELKKKENAMKVSRLEPTNLDNNYDFVCYVKENMDVEFNEDKTVRRHIKSNDNNVQLDLSEFNHIQKLRIDPIDTNCIIKIKKIYMIINSEEIPISILSTNGMYLYDNIFLFSNDDPQIYIETPLLRIDKLVVEFKLVDYDLDNISQYQSIIEEVINKKQAIIDNRERDIEEKEAIIRDKECIIEEKQNIIYDKECIIKEKQNIIYDKECIIEENKNHIKNIIVELEQYKVRYNKILEQKNDLSNSLANTQAMYNEIINSTSWKITKPIRRILDIIKAFKEK